MTEVEKYERGTIEIVVHERDFEGNPTGRTFGRKFDGGHADKLADWYNKNRFHIPRKKKKDEVATAVEAEQILEEVNTTYADKVRKQRRKFDDGESI